MNMMVDQTVFQDKKDVDAWMHAHQGFIVTDWLCEEFAFFVANLRTEVGKLYAMARWAK